MMTVTIEGVEDIQKAFANFPKEMDKTVTDTMRKAAKPYVNNVKSYLPWPKWASTVKIRTKIKKKGDLIMMSAGVFGEQAKGGEIPDYFKLYWSNFGTLKRRDPNHEFKYPIKRNKARRNEEGQPALNFVGKALEGGEEAVAEQVKAAVEHKAETLFK